MNERVLCVLSAIHSFEPPYPSFGALLDAIADAVTASPDHRHVYVYALDAARDGKLMQQTELPVPTSFMVSDLRDMASDGDVTLSDILNDMDGLTWNEYRINTDLFIR